MERLLRSAADLANSFVSPDYADNHADRCQTSCPDCLRDYSNLAWHNILDWRMAIDLARLALDANSPVDFTTAHWQSLVALAAPPYFRALAGRQRRLAACPQPAQEPRPSSSCIRCGPINTPPFFKLAARLRLLELRSLERKRYSSFFDGRFDATVTQKTDRRVSCRACSLLGVISTAQGPNSTPSQTPSSRP